MVNQKVWHAREAVVKMAQDVTITGAAALDTFFSAGSTVTGVMKDISITEPNSDVSSIDLLGIDSNGFQNIEGEVKPYGMAEVTGTMILPGDEVVESFMFPAGSAIAATHTRYQPGKVSRRTPSILLNLNDGTDTVNIVLDNAWITARDVKVTGADGHFEATFTAKCLPRDFYLEFKD
jgi:hypothetical protein